MDYIEHCKSNFSLTMNSTINILTHMFCVNGNGVDSRTFNLPEVVYYKDHEGNIQERFIGRGMTLDENYFKNLEPVSVSYTYSWSEKEEYQPFRNYHGIKDQSTILGLKSAVEYFIKCLEVSTIDTIMVEYCKKQNEMMVAPLEKYLDERNVPQEHRSTIFEEFMQENNIRAEKEFQNYKSNYETYLSDWKKNIPVLKSEFGLE